jgi:hypothetical protein
MIEFLKSQLKPKNAFFLFMGGACLFYFERIILGELAPIRFWDEFNFNFAIHHDYGALFLKHGPFYWYPSIAGGLPAFANLFSPISPLSFATQVMPLPILYTVILILTIGLAGYGMFVFLQKVFNLEDKLAFIGGAVFALSVAQTRLLHDEFIFAYLFPLFLVFTSYLGREKNKWLIGGYLIAIIIFSLSEVVATVHYAYSHLLIILFWGAEDDQTTRRKAIAVVFLWFAYGIFNLPTVYALFEYIPFQSRTYSPMLFGQILGSLSTIYSYFYQTHILFLIPGSLVLALYCRNLRRYLIPVIIITIIICFFRLPTKNILHGTFFEKMDLRQGFSTIFFFYIAFGFISFKYAIESKRYFKIFSFGILGGIVLISILKLNVPQLHDFSFERMELFVNIFVSFAVYSFLFWIVQQKFGWNLFGYQKGLKKLTIVCVSLTIVLSLLIAKRMTFAEIGIDFRQFGDLTFISKNIDNSKVGRIATLGIPNSIVRFAGYEALGGQSAFFYTPFREYFLKIIQPQLDQLTPKQLQELYSYRVSIGLMFPHHFGFEHFERPRFWGGLPEDLGIDFELLKEINVTHIITTEKHPQLDAIAKNVISDDYLLAEARDPFKFTSLTALIDRVKEKFKRIKQYRHLEIYELNGAKERVFFNEKQSDGEMITKNVDLIEYSPDKLIIEFDAKNLGTLEISNNYHPNWKATVNDSPIPVFKSRSAFQGIEIKSSGKKRIILEYIDKPLMYLFWFCQPFALFLIAFFYHKKSRFRGV